MKPAWASSLILACFVPLIVSETNAEPALREAQSPECHRGDPLKWDSQMHAYGNSGDFRAVHRRVDGELGAVLVEIPPILFSGKGQSSNLPVGPCQHIYRFQYVDLRLTEGEGEPFHYAEIDWNTEGLPRGPNGSFESAHFDFHFYLQPRQVIQRELQCVVSSNGKTCDAMKSAYAQIRRFLNMPLQTYLPKSYRPDIGSSIPAMGLHHLDK